MIRDAYLETAALARRLMAEPAVTERWEQPSALRLMTVGALAGHLARSITLVPHYLGQTSASSGGQLLTADTYFARGAEITNDLDSALNVGIRERSVQMAAAGSGALLVDVDAALDAAQHAFATLSPEQEIEAFAGSRMLLDEYLVTRMVELTVHGDDLAVSVDVATPEFPAVAYACTLGGLLQMARSRHGDLAVLRAMARRERDAVEALRVL